MVTTPSFMRVGNIFKNAFTRENVARGVNLQDKIDSVVGNAGQNMAQLIASTGGGAAPDACAATGDILINAIKGTGQSLQAGQVTSHRPVADILGEIKRKLKHGYVVSVTIREPHHVFTLLNMGEGRVRILQSYQDSYSYADWLANGRTDWETDKLLSWLKQLTDGGPLNRAAIVGNLFAYPAVRDEVVSHFGAPIRISNIGYAPT